MKVIKNINNNICLCVDSKGRELIAFGKGIGFIKPPHDIPLEKINRTFYKIDDAIFDVIQDLPAEVLNVSIQIIDRASDQLDAKYPASAIFALADHIHFAIQRKSNSIFLDIPIVQDIKHLYPQEWKVANWALDLINEKLNVDLDESELGTLCLHLINDKEQVENNSTQVSKRLLEMCTELIEECTGIAIDRNSFHYSRFATHFDYLIRRPSSYQKLSVKDAQMMQVLKTNYATNFQATEKIAAFIEETIHLHLSDEEKLYLLIHINKLCDRQV